MKEYQKAPTKIKKANKTTKLTHAWGTTGPLWPADNRIIRGSHRTKKWRKKPLGEIGGSLSFALHNYLPRKVIQ